MMNNFVLAVLYCSATGGAMRHHFNTFPTSSLELVHVVFRHGQRTPDPSTIYPNDIYKNETYYPYGLGALTNDGKRTLYDLGRALRHRYDFFLGKVYTPNTLDVQSSPVKRAKISAQLVLASLFPPVDVQKWNYFLNWQPIDFEYQPTNEDLLFLNYQNCQKYMELLSVIVQRVVNDVEIMDIDKVSAYLTFHTGWNVTSLYDIFLVYAALTSESEWGFELSSWTEEVYPEPLTSMATTFFTYATETDALKTLSAGFILKRIAEDTQMKINGSANLKDRKMVLYSGHDFTIASLLSTLGIFKPHHPTYGSYIIFEVHRTGQNDYGLKVFYQDYSSNYPNLMTLPGCGEICPFDTFLDMYSKYFALPAMCDLN